jgi:hypothetical protein
MLTQPNLSFLNQKDIQNMLTYFAKPDNTIDLSDFVLALLWATPGPLSLKLPQLYQIG